jgi:hypothetical protein
MRFFAGFVMLVWGNLIYLSILDSSFLHLPRALAKPASSLGPVIESSDNERDGLMTAKASDCAEGDPGDKVVACLIVMKEDEKTHMLTLAFDRGRN